LSTTGVDSLKREAAEAAIDGEVRSGMVLGLGTGSTANHLLDGLAARIADGRLSDIVGVPTSEATGATARRLGISIATLDERPRLDLAIDGADEIDPALDVIKGLGGALLREKIVAASSGRMIVIADKSKLVGTLGRFPLPIEVNKFGLRATEIAIGAAAAGLGLSGPVTLRMTGDQPFVTDGGHFILDASFGRIPDTRALSTALHAIPGVVEHGLFVGMADEVLVAGAGGIATMVRQ